MEKSLTATAAARVTADLLEKTIVARLSAGLLMYRVQNGAIQVLLAHPGGPYFRNRDEGAWSIPKGEPEEGEDLLEPPSGSLKRRPG